MRQVLLVAALALAPLPGGPPPGQVLPARDELHAPQLDWQVRATQLSAEIDGLKREVASLKTGLAKLRQDYAGHVHDYTLDGKQHRTTPPLAEPERR